MAVAEKVDAWITEHDEALELPSIWLLHVHEEVPRLSYRQLTVAQLVRMVRLFSPTGLQICCDPHELSVEWNTQLHLQYPVRLCATVIPVQGVTPRYTANIYQAQDGRMVRVDNEAAWLPENHPTLRQRRGRKVNDLQHEIILDLLHPDNAVTAIEWWFEEMQVREAKRQVLYEDAKRRLLSFSSFEPSEDELRRLYANTSLKAGTFEQWRCLHTAAAMNDRHVAQNYWPEYSKEHGIRTTAAQSYFDSYAWALSWLERHALKTVLLDGVPYLYGTKWL
jgi:hypothetical protein